MNNLPLYLQVLFALTTLLTVYFFFRASGKSIVTLIVLVSWLTIQGIIGHTDFYMNNTAMPPRVFLLLGPPLILIIFLFATKKGRAYTDRLKLQTLTILHVIRIPVEIGLFLLFSYGTIPVLMTFEGRNFDVLSGITAPVIWYFGFVKKTLSKSILIAWNIICLALVLNVVFYGVLSVPTPFQQFSFEQPNTALLHFPYNWLPCCIVPLVLFSHFASLRQLIKK